MTLNSNLLGGLFFLSSIALGGVASCSGNDGDGPDDGAALDYGTHDVVLTNQQATAADVYITWQSDSAYGNSDWDACNGQAAPYCKTSVPANSSVTIPNAVKKYLNLNVSFNKTTFGTSNQCGATLAEVNVNKPTWYAVMDVSVVNGFNEKIQINAGGTTLGPAVGETGNEKVFGVFPYGCDGCAKVLAPPCGDDGDKECHAGTQSDPDPKCQYQMEESGTVEIVLVK